VRGMEILLSYKSALHLSDTAGEFLMLGREPS
jgi:hypothetical protein